MDDVDAIFRAESQNFIAVVSANMPWKKMSEEVILDVGCGYTRSCCEIIVKYFPDVGKIIGIDCNPDVIAKARAENSYPNVEYHYANIIDRSTLQRWEGNITKVVSTHCFHQIRSKELAFRNVYGLLKAGGEASFLFCLESGVTSWWAELLANPKWTNIYQGPVENFAEIYPKHCTPSYYENMMRAIGFAVVHCSGEARIIPFATDEICRENMIMTLNKFAIPPAIREELYAESFDIYTKYNYRNAEGKFCCRSYNVTLVVRKPKETSEED